MKIYINPPQPSLGLERIATALRRYAPANVSISTFPRNVDLTVIYAIGRRDAIQRQVDDILSRGKKYAIVQVALRSTMSPDPWQWVNIWRDAEVVWSYYDLEAALKTGEYLKFAEWRLPNFYHAPLGADAEVFKSDGPYNRSYLIMTTGSSWLSESVRECHMAAWEIGPQVLRKTKTSETTVPSSCHLGAKFKDRFVDCFTGLADIFVANLYSRCQFVSGLRRTEGFELPAVEGLLCGARPIVFDTPDYHWNYGDHAEYIKEGTRQEVVDQLVELFKRGARGVTEEERADAVERFNWETIVRGFYERLQC